MARPARKPLAPPLQLASTAPAKFSAFTPFESTTQGPPIASVIRDAAS